MKYKIILLLGIFVFFSFYLNRNDAVIIVKWNKSHKNEKLFEAETGLKWALSNVGASILNKENIKVNVKDKETDFETITIDVSKMGFNENAEKLFCRLHQKIKDSEEYETNNSIDLGRYVALILGSSEHYYALIETPKTLEEITKNYTLLPEKGYVNNSTVSKVHRIIQYSEQKQFNQLFLAQEIDSITGKIFEFETIELFKNGQLRFGIFDANGNRKIAANSKHTEAGKPAKCMWCHESNIQPMFSDQKNRNGFLPFMKLQEIFEKYRDKNIADKIKYVDVLNNIDYKQTQDHTLTEIIYISFMEPSAERLSLEWGIPINEVKKKLKKLPTHIYEEFPYLGNLYHRKDVEKYAPFKGLKVSGSVREATETEVNYMK